MLILGKRLGYTFNNRNFHNVSLGQGQEVVAEAALELAAKKGHWVILQVPSLCPGLGQSCSPAYSGCIPEPLGFLSALLLTYLFLHALTAYSARTLLSLTSSSHGLLY